MNPVTTIVAIVMIAGLASAIVAVLRLEHPWLQPWAIARAILQLGVLSLILGGIIASPLWVGMFLVLMVAAATWVIQRRLELPLRRLPLILGTVAASAAVPMALIFATSAVAFTPRYLLAVGGIVIGNAMTVSTLMGRSLTAAYRTQHDEIEGWLAIGATPRRAAQRAVRLAGSTALIPSTDQTRTTGIVTLPGAFVGAVFAGSSPIEAAQFQLVVLAAILLAGAITAAIFAGVWGAPRTFPAD